MRPQKTIIIRSVEYQHCPYNFWLVSEVDELINMIIRGDSCRVVRLNINEGKFVHKK